MVDKLLEKDIEQAEEFYKKGFEIYKDLLQIDTSNYIDILAYSLVEQAKISYLKKNKKEAKELYCRALEIYRKLDNKFYEYEIKNIENKLNQLKNSKVKIKHGEGWAYIGKFFKGEWKKQYFWLKESNTIILRNSQAIAISGVKLRKKPSGHSKEIGGISLGSLVTIKKIKIYKKEDENHIWAYIKY